MSGILPFMCCISLSKTQQLTTWADTAFFSISMGGLKTHSDKMKSPADSTIIKCRVRKIFPLTTAAEIIPCYHNYLLPDVVSKKFCHCPDSGFNGACGATLAGDELSDLQRIGNGTAAGNDGMACHLGAIFITMFTFLPCLACLIKRLFNRSLVFRTDSQEGITCLPSIGEHICVLTMFSMKHL